MNRIEDAPIRLARHADLKHREQGDVLVLPERAIRLAGSGAEILALCDGSRDVAAIVAVLAERYPDTPGLEDEVVRFLQEMDDLGGIERGTAGEGSEG